MSTQPQNFGNSIQNPERYTFWQSPKEKRCFLLVDYYINSQSPAESYVVMKELIDGQLKTEAKILAFDLYQQLVNEKKLEEVGVVVR